MRQVKSLGSVTFEYGSLFIVEELSPKNKTTEVYLAADNSRIYYSATLLNAPLTIDSREYSWVTDEQRISILASYEADEELTVVFTDNYTATAKFALETPPTFQELSEGSCLYTAVLPMYYTSTPIIQPDYEITVRAETPDKLDVNIYLEVSGQVSVFVDGVQSYIASPPDSDVYLPLSEGQHTIGFLGVANITYFGVGNIDGMVPPLPANITDFGGANGWMTGYSGTSFSGNLVRFSVNHNTISTAELDSILAKLDAAGAINGYSSFRYNSVPTNQTAIDSLRAKGWTVQVDV